MIIHRLINRLLEYCGTRSLGALRAQLLVGGPLGRLDIVLRAHAMW